MDLGLLCLQVSEFIFAEERRDMLDRALMEIENDIQEQRAQEDESGLVATTVPGSPPGDAIDSKRSLRQPGNPLSRSTSTDDNGEKQSSQYDDSSSSFSASAVDTPPVAHPSDGRSRVGSGGSEGGTGGLSAFDRRVRLMMPASHALWIPAWARVQVLLQRDASHEAGDDTGSSSSAGDVAPKRRGWGVVQALRRVATKIGTTSTVPTSTECAITVAKSRKAIAEITELLDEDTVDAMYALSEAELRIHARLDLMLLACTHLARRLWTAGTTRAVIFVHSPAVG